MQSVGSSADDFTSAVLPVPAGSTLVRLHFQIHFQDWGTLVFDDRPFGTTNYALIIDDQDPHTDPPGLFEFQDTPWLHWEGVFYNHWFTPLGEYDVHEGPRDGSVRDVKAQRVIDTENPLLQLRWFSIDSGVSTPVPYVDMAYEAMFLLPSA